jgi:hypothetical protein
MPRYVVQRRSREGLRIPAGEEGVTWINSFVSDDKTRAFCIYDAPTPEAIRRTAARNAVPVDAITRVSVLDPYFYV